jgi:hypothetical protein
MIPWSANADQVNPGKHLFILSGQSNMTGTLAKSFKECVEQTFGEDNVIVVRTGHPGQPLKNWYKAWQPPEGMTDDKPENNGKLYDVLIKAVNRAVKDRPIATTTFIWMQGETDAGNGWGSVYEKSFVGLLEQLKQDLAIKEMNFVVGRINEHWLEKKDGELMRQVLQKLGTEHANGDWIDTDDINRGVNPWGGYSFEDGHYPPAGYVVMGQRFAKTACKLIDPEIKLDPAVYEEVFFDSADQIKTHAAVGKTIDGQGWDALLDGKFGPLNHEHPAWVGIGPDQDPYELVIDLGEVMEIDSVAVHTLLSSKAKAQFPKQLGYSVSEDGETYQVNNNRYNTIKFYNGRLLKQMRSEGIKPTPLLLLTQQYGSKARYIKITIETGDQWVFIDEIVVNPSRK